MLRFVASQGEERGERREERGERREERGERREERGERRAGEQESRLGSTRCGRDEVVAGQSWHPLAQGQRACLMRVICEGIQDNDGIGLVRGNR
jgi:hypothetical protein